MRNCSSCRPWQRDTSIVYTLSPRQKRCKWFCLKLEESQIGLFKHEVYISPKSTGYSSFSIRWQYSIYIYIPLFYIYIYLSPYYSSFSIIYLYIYIYPMSSLFFQPRSGYESQLPTKWVICRPNFLHVEGLTTLTSQNHKFLLLLSSSIIFYPHVYG